MALPIGVGVLFLFHAALVALVAVAVAAVGSLLAPPAWTSAPNGANRWTTEAQAMVREVERVLDDGETLPYGHVQRQLLPLSSRLDRHAELAPPPVDDELVVGITQLAIGCRVVGMELTHAQRLDWAAPGSDVAAVATAADELSVALDPTSEPEA